MLRLLLAFALLPLPGYAQVRVVVPSAVAEVKLSVAPAPVPSVLPAGMPSLPAGLSALTPAISAIPSVAPIDAAVAVKAAVPVKAAVAVKTTALAAKIAPAPSTPDKPSRPAEQTKSEGSSMFDGAMNILIAGSEAVPFIKTGGLADVIDAVSRGLAARGHDVTVVLPKYKQLKTSGMDLREAGSVSVPIDGRVETANMLVGERAGVRVVLLEHPGFYEREGGPYAARQKPVNDAVALSAYEAGAFDDADERFGFYARAALEAVKALGVRPDIVHAHDWHAALIPALLKHVYKNDPFFADTRTALTIHNIAFQGAFGLGTLVKLGLPLEDAVPELVHNGGSNFLKSGIALADLVTTVSPTYAREIVENPVFGMGMEKTLRARGEDGVRGVINGIDPELYDPGTDPELARHYGVEDAAEGKAGNKAALQSKLGLDLIPDAPLFVVASRLAHQKGIDMIFDSAKDIVALGGQLAIMGSGDPATEAMRAMLVKAFPGKIASHPFDENAVRLLFAAADFLLMPSRFEPCGLSQLIAQRYGTIPLVTGIGGLADTVVDLRDDPVNGTGLFIRAQASISLSRTIADAVKGYRHPEAFALARRAAMTKDSSWQLPLDLYEALFRFVLNRRAEGPEKR